MDQGGVGSADELNRQRARLEKDELNRQRARLEDVEHQNRKLRDQIASNKTVRLDHVRVKSLEVALHKLLDAVKDATRDETVPARLQNAIEIAESTLGPRGGHA